MSSACCALYWRQREPDLARLLVAHDARQLRGPEAGVEGADARAGLPEDRRLRGDREVADHVQHMPAADRVAVHEGDHRLRHRADVALQRQHVEARHAVIADVAALTTHALVAAGTEGARARAGEQHHADAGVVVCLRERIEHLVDGLGPEGGCAPPGG